MDGRCKPWNLDNYAEVSRGILWTDPRNLAKIFRRKLWALDKGAYGTKALMKRQHA